MHFRPVKVKVGIIIIIIVFLTTITMLVIGKWSSIRYSLTLILVFKQSCHISYHSMTD